MATAQESRAKPSRLAERDPQVYHPLDQLRGIIRRYVVIEGVLSVFLFLAIWFTAGLILDYGIFKTLGWDWVRDGSWWVRLLALLGAVTIFVSILVFRIARALDDGILRTRHGGWFSGTCKFPKVTATGSSQRSKWRTLRRWASSAIRRK